MPSHFPAVITLQQLQCIIDANPFGTWLGLKVESVTDAGIELSIQSRPEMIGTQALNRLHGGIVATLIDSACGYALISATGSGISAISLQTDFHRAAPLDELRICGHVEHIGGRICTASAQIIDGQGELIASGRCSLYKAPSPHPVLAG